jgi:hypothetical protein
VNAQKRCERCGRFGSAMLPLHNRWVDRIDGWVCRDRPACDARAADIGKWVGVRVLRRTDADGTHWTIRRHDDIGNRGIIGALCDSGVVLMMQYRDHRLVSQHSDVAAAKAHVDDLLASWKARSLRDYAEGQR